MTGGTIPRRLAIRDTYNLRDVGGYPASGGMRTAWGRLLRSDCPQLTEAGEAGFRELRLQTVIDLRDEAEIRTRPTVLDGLVAHVVRRPLDTTSLLDELPADRGDLLGAILYAAALSRGRQIAAAIGELCRPGALPALVHCTAGKDRTGIVVALTLSCVGVPDEVVAADFALSSTYLTPAFFAAAEHRIPARHRAGVDLTVRREAEPASMIRLLRAVRADHGSVRDYLVAHGLRAADLDELRAALVEPTAPRYRAGAPS